MAVIVGRILESIYAMHETPFVIYQNHMNDIEAWGAKATISLQAIGQSDLTPARESEVGTSSVDQTLWKRKEHIEKLEFHLQTSYLGAMMLLTRPLLLQYANTSFHQFHSAYDTPKSLTAYAQLRLVNL
jgi:hypothetical protein